MSSGNQRSLLSIGVFFVTVVVALLLYLAAVVTDWVLLVPLVILFNGVWLLALGALQMGKPVKYGTGSFNLAGMGILAVAVGGAWLLWSTSWIISVIIVLLAVAGIAIAAAMQHK